MLPDPDFGLEPNERNERGKRLSRIVPVLGARFRYEYDYGDNWQHEIVVEQILTAEPGKVYPVCLGESGPFLRKIAAVWMVIRNYCASCATRVILSMPLMRMWAGEGYDPEAFDLAAANRSRESWRVLCLPPRHRIPPTPLQAGSSYTQRQGQFRFLSTTTRC